MNTECQVQEDTQRGHWLYDSTYGTFWKRQNQTDGKQVRGWQGLGKQEGPTGKAQGIAGGGKSAWH